MMNACKQQMQSQDAVTRCKGDPDRWAAGRVETRNMERFRSLPGAINMAAWFTAAASRGVIIPSKTWGACPRDWAQPRRG